MNAVVHPRVEVRAVATTEELRLAHDMMARTHVPEYSASMSWLESSALAYPGLRREHTRVALRDGELAGALRLTTDTIRLGEARLKMGGLGWVTTDARHRHCGVASALIGDTLDYMREHGYHVSMLFGIPNFYHRFGYATALAEYSITLSAADLPAAGPGRFRVRAVKPGDIAAIQRIHRDSDADVACSLIRASAHYAAKWRRLESANVLVNGNGKVGAYIAAKIVDGTFEVTEAGFDSDFAAAELLSHCARTAADASCARVRFNVPPEHPLARSLAQYESIHEMRLSRERGGMMTFVDVPESLESLVPEWEAQLLQNGRQDIRAEVTLVVDGIAHRVQAHHGAVSVRPGAGPNKFSVSGVELIRLATGYVHLEDVLHARPRLLSPDARALLACLFPKRNPYVHLFDRF